MTLVHKISMLDSKTSCDYLSMPFNESLASFDIRRSSGSFKILKKMVQIPHDKAILNFSISFSVFSSDCLGFHQKKDDSKAQMRLILIYLTNPLIFWDMHLSRIPHIQSQWTLSELWGKRNPKLNNEDCLKSVFPSQYIQTCLFLICTFQIC